MSMILKIEEELGKKIDKKLVSELLGAYVEAKKNYYLGGLRLSEVEGGRFCEAAFRILQFVTTKNYDAFDKRVDTDKEILRLGNLPAANYPASIRLHIPRSLRVIYDIRNNRDVAHLADGIDPNTQDSTLVVSVLDWVLAELLRLFHGIPASEAQKIVVDLVTKSAPAIQEFDGFLKVLKPDLSASEYILLLLYQTNDSGAKFDQLSNWVKPSMKKNLKRTLSILCDEKAFIHFDSSGQRYLITRSGIVEVDKRKLIVA